MELFATTLKHAAMVGIIPNLERKFNRRNIIVMLIFAFYFISATLYFIFDADTFLDYQICFFAWNTLLFVNIGFIIMVLKTKHIQELHVKVLDEFHIRKSIL